MEGFTDALELMSPGPSPRMSKVKSELSPQAKPLTLNTEADANDTPFDTLKTRGQKTIKSNEPYRHSASARFSENHSMIHKK